MKKQIIPVLLLAAMLLTVNTSFASGNTVSKSNKGYVVHTVIDGRPSTTAYNKNGKWVYTIQQYNANNLDENIIDRVKSVYYRYDITGIQKVEQPGQDVVYVVHLEDSKSIKIVRLVNDEMELIEDLVKG
jgi:hypothetical protein